MRLHAALLVVRGRPASEAVAEARRVAGSVEKLVEDVGERLEDLRALPRDVRDAYRAGLAKPVVGGHDIRIR